MSKSKVLQIELPEESLSLVAKESVRNFTDLRAYEAKLPDIPTEQLALGYAQLKPFENVVKTFTKAVRDELIEVRFNSKDEPIVVDEKGHKHMVFGDTELIAEKRVGSKSLLTGIATAILTEKGLFDKVCDKTLIVTDGNELLKITEELLQYAPKEVQEEMRERINQLIVTDKHINEDKLEGLYKLEMITKKEYDSMYSEPEPTYALKVGKPKKSKK